MSRVNAWHIIYATRKILHLSVYQSSAIIIGRLPTIFNYSTFAVRNLSLKIGSYAKPKVDLDYCYTTNKAINKINYSIFVYTLAQDEAAKNVATQRRTQICENIFALRSS
jgi:hypothetical protein